jgi:hypothetical protein
MYGCFLSTHHCIIEIQRMFGIMMSLRKSWLHHDFVEAPKCNFWKNHGFPRDSADLVIDPNMHSILSLSSFMEVKQRTWSVKMIYRN